MSFASIFATIKTISGVLTPVVSKLNPTAATIMNAVNFGADVTEAVHAGVLNGQQKKDSAMQIAMDQIQAQLPNLTGIAAQFGAAVTPQQHAAIATLMDDAVKLKNDLAAATALFPAKPETA